MWYNIEGKDSDVILNSRVALSRNLEEYPFADRMSDEQAKEFVEKMKSVCRAEDGWTCTELADAGEEQKRAMAEQRIIPRETAESAKPAAVFQNEDFTVSVTAGGMDHVRIEAVASGNDLASALDRAFETEQLVDDAFPIAFTEQFGYVTRNPELLGTGMRASMTLHLPLCGEAGWLTRAAFRMAKDGVAIRSMDGDGMTTGLYVISNRETMGMSEEEIVKTVTEAAERLVAKEREYRESLSENYRAEIAEEVRRNYGVLMYARRLGAGELCSMYSKMRMAAALNLADIPVPLVDEAMFTCLPYTLAAAEGKTEKTSLDEARAARARDILSGAGLREGR
jgi:protein arginine kinase